MEVQDGFVVPEVSTENPAEPDFIELPPADGREISFAPESPLASEPQPEQLVSQDELDARIELVVQDTRNELDFLSRAVLQVQELLISLQVQVAELKSRIDDHNMRASHKI